MFSTPIGPKPCPGLTCTDSAQFQKKIPTISHGGSCSPKDLELGHFTLLFCRGRQRNVPRFKTHVHSHCSAHCSAQFQKKIPPISHGGSCSPKDLELGHFTLLFCRGRQRNVPRFKTHVHSHCSAH